MTAGDVRELFEYNAWANRRVFEVAGGLAPDEYLRDLGSSFGGVHGTVAHIAGAERLWLDRWLGTEPSPRLLGPGDFPDLAAVVAAWERLEVERLRWLEGLTDTRLRQTVTIAPTAGGAYAHVLRETLLHAVEHSSYHRGQVITLVRQLGHTVPSPSFNLIHFYRARSREGKGRTA
jgi:uncharacterized damage-inducible protein DinB